jgi:hypothetical protein
MIRSGFLHGADELKLHLVGHGIAPLWAIQRDCANRGIIGDQDRFVIHLAPLSARLLN